MATDPHVVLGVSKSASDKEIRSAYRKLAKELHPDLNPGNKKAEERFKEVSAAFAILGDEERRNRFDAGEIDATDAEKPDPRYYYQYADSGPDHPYTSQAGFEDLGDLGDLFAEAFARRGGGPGQGARGGRAGRNDIKFPGADARYHLQVSFLDAATGARKRVIMPDGGTLDVTIPAGIDDGQVLRLKGKGEPGFNGGPPGDALVSIEVAPHPIFSREGSDILVEVPVGIHEAVLGKKIEVPTIGGRVNVSVPKGATTGQTLRLNGKGIATKKGKGDQLVRLKIVMPPKVDPELETFMQSWAEKQAYNPRSKMERAS